MSGGTALQLAIDGLAASGVYALVAIGVQLAYAGSGVLHLALGDAAVAGAIGGAALAESGAPAWACALVAMLVGAALSGAMERALVRPARGRMVVAVAALVAGGTVVRQVVGALFTHASYAFPSLAARWQVGGGVVRAADALAAGITVVVAVCAGLVLVRTRFGAALRLTAGGEAGAESIGVDTRRVRAAAFALAGLLAALAAVLAAGRVAAAPATGVAIGFKGLSAAAAGRFASPLTACAGAVVIGGTEVGTTFALGGGGEAITYGVALGLLALGWRGGRGRR